MKKVWLVTLSIITSVIMSLLFSFSPQKAAAAQNDLRYESYYLVNGETPYKSTQLAGYSTGGYGDLEINKSTTIYANAADGYRLVGWYIEYIDRVQNDEPAQTKFITKAGATPEELGSQVITYNVQFDVTQNGTHYDGSFNIDRVGENLNIIPVFDFEYYKLNITNFYDLIDGLTFDETYQIYYTENQDNNYTNAILKQGNDYFYLGNASLNGDKICTSHNTMPAEGEAEARLIDASLGAWRVNEKVDLSLKLKTKSFENIFSDSSNNKNVNLLSASLVGDTATADLTHLLNKTQSAEKITTAFKLTFDFSLKQDEIERIYEDADKQLNLNLQYCQIFAVEIVPYVDGKILGDADSEVRTLILEQLQITPAYYTFAGEPVCKYLIRKARDNSGLGAKLVYPETIYYQDEQTKERYYYYQISSLPTTDFADINQNTQIKVEYKSVTYQVRFQFVLKNQNVYTTLNDMNVEPSINLARGQSPAEDIKKTENSNNIGYKFLGFTTDLSKLQSGEEASETLEKDSIKIDETKPTDIVVYMVFEYEKYTIKLTGLQSAELTNKEQNVYPFNSLTLTTQDKQLQATDLQNSEYSFVDKFIVVDNLNFTFRLNAGFVVQTFAVGALSVDASAGSAAFSMKEILQQNDLTGNTIEIKITCDYLTYTLDYTLNAATDTDKGQTLLMGSISITLSGTLTGNGEQTIDFTNFNESETQKEFGRIKVELTKTENVLKLHLDGLRMYDEVTLNATANVKENDTYYQFNRFLESSINTLPLEKSSPEHTFSTKYSMFKNADVVVTFVMPTTLFEVVADLNAIDYTDITVEVSGQSYNLDATGQIEKINTGEATVRFNSYAYGGKGVKFGYKFVSATFTGEDTSSVSPETTENQISIKITLSTEAKYTLNLHFEEIEYQLSITQLNADKDGNEDWQGKKVKFDEFEYKTMKVPDLSVSFDAPVGYYAGRFYKDEWTVDLGELDSTTNLINYTFDVSEFEDLVNKLNIGSSNQVEINVEYLIRRYSLTVQFVVDSDRAQYDDRVLAILPNVTIDGQSSVRRQNSLVFSDIPYNTHLEVKLAGGIRVGLEAVGWFNSNGEAVADTSIQNGNLAFNITQNVSYIYKLQYEAFTILLTKEENSGLELDLAGDPVAKINGEIGTQIRLFDTLTVNANAHRTNGYTLDHIYYQAFVRYTANNWQQDKQNLYYLSDGKYIKVEDGEEFNSQYQYFSLQEVLVEDGAQLKEFDMSTMLLTRQEEVGYLEFIIVYKELDINLKDDEYRVLYHGEISDSLQEYRGNFGFIDTPRYKFMRYQKDTGDWQEDLSPNQSALHYRDIVHVYTNFKTIDGTPFGVDGEINLKLGIKLTIFVGGQAIALTPSDECDNYFWFNLNSVLSSLDVSDTLTIIYQFEIEDKTLTYTVCSNEESAQDITEQTFFKQDEQNSFTLNIEKTGEGIQTLPYDQDGILKFDSPNMFLLRASLGYKFDDFTLDGSQYNYGDFLIVSGVKVFVLNSQGGWDEVVDESEIKNLGISVSYKVSGEVDRITYCYLSNVKLQLVLQPKIEGFHTTLLAGKELYAYNSLLEGDLDTPFTRVHQFVGDYLFNLDPVNNNKIVGQSQPGLTVGTSSNCNIEICHSSDYLSKYAQVELQYYFNNRPIALENIVNAGEYLIKLKFSSSSPNWLQQIGFDQYNIVMIINPISLKLDYNGKYAKPYEGQNKTQINPSILENEIRNNLVFMANDCLTDIRFDQNKIPLSAQRQNIVIPMYTEQGGENPNFRFGSQLTGRITTTINEQEVGVYNVGINYLTSYEYNITLEHIYLICKDNAQTNNFRLDITNNKKTFYNCATITPKKVYLENLRFRDKLYDGTDAAIIDARYSYTVSGLGDDAQYIQIFTPQALFVSDENQVGKDVGANKRIYIANLDSLLVGSLARNYLLELPVDSNYTASIYPDKVSVKVEGYGTITLVNELGKTDYSKVNLIGINAELSVELVRAETGAYNRIYRYIASYLKSKSYGIGYRLHLTENGAEKPISNQLSLQLPNINKLSGVVHLNGNNTASQLNFDIDGGIIIDLRQLDSPNLFIVIKNRPLFTWWQILLIVLLSLLVVAIIVVIVLVRRKKKLDKYKEHDKI